MVPIPVREKIGWGTAVVLTAAAYAGVYFEDDIERFLLQKEVASKCGDIKPVAYDSLGNPIFAASDPSSRGIVHCANDVVRGRDCEAIRLEVARDIGEVAGFFTCDDRGQLVLKDQGLGPDLLMSNLDKVKSSGNCSDVLTDGKQKIASAIESVRCERVK